MASSRIRHDPSWSARQGLAGSFLKLFLRAYTACHFKWPISLKPHHEGNRFVVIEPATLDFYEGVTVDSEIKPEAIGATWYPEPCSAATEVPDGQSVVLHLHGGSYVLGDGRTSSCNFLAKTLLTHTPASHLLCLQYRLACNPNGRFPAQLQDTIAAYVYLIHTLHIPPDRIVLSGDSSGGHLALAMLRYIVEYDDPCRLPPPKCSWLWSPWCDVPAAVDPDSWTQSPNYETEYIPGSFPTWGARQFLRDLAITETMERYVAPIHHPFVLPSPVLIVTGGREVLFPDHQQLVQRFQKMASNGPRIELVVEEKVPHDVLMIGWIMRFYQEAEACAKRAGEFVQRVESSERSTATVQD
ncbi:alpha/beta hydrolase [Aspergillus homomorphus CBS 101889]|uniref:Alpha/beta-hydrolase n=1 Tax=Aspergillus homomorphus (strain CBS 101889) TaxID=1450537 RepID=A0A395I4Q3_ASPHC|nr:alpha/beta-hydrolase [Aspergillus homomorphus CBS 101889]RAL14719.1 alpha/beta-hydrolase [Aspergillus homomorphus CBS 101889]